MLAESKYEGPPRNPLFVVHASYLQCEYRYQYHYHTIVVGTGGIHILDGNHRAPMLKQIHVSMLLGWTLHIQNRNGRISQILRMRIIQRQ